MLKTVNSVIVFLMELVMLFAFAAYGYSKGSTWFTKYFFAFILMLVAIALWGFFAAPRSANRLPVPYVFFFRTTMFLIGAFFLYLLDYRSAGFVLAFLAVLTQIIDFSTE